MAIRFGFGRYNDDLSPPDLVKILKCFFPLGLVAFWASSLARIAIGGMLLRFPISKAWHVVLWALIVTQFAMAIGADIFQLLQCRPIRALWEPVPGAECWSAETSRIYTYIYAGAYFT